MSEAFFIKKSAAAGRSIIKITSPKIIFFYLQQMKKIALLLFVFSYSTSFSQKISSDYFFVRTRDSLPFLKYGLGEDRLGGAKLGFLDSNVLLKVVDSIDRNYKVQLSQYHSAYIDKRNVYLSPVYKIKDQHLSQNWSVYGDSAYDYVTIMLDEKLPYKSVQQIDPSRIVIDIFGATSNTNWITQLNSVREIKNAWYEQPEDDVMRVIIELKHQQHWGYKIYYTGNRLTVMVKRQPEKLKLRNLTIAIDAGHGGENTGATGVSSNIKEKDYTLLLAKQLEKALIKKKAKVIMTREKDTTLSMYERISFLDKLQPDLLISIHLNSSSSQKTSGVSTYYRYIGFRPLSQAILQNMLELGLNQFGNVGSFNFSLSGPTEYPNCLVEVAFLSNKEDEKKILDPKFHEEVAKKIIDGIEDFLKNL
jgi:N-acetylmuramoyl-L-alanine amidase